MMRLLLVIALAVLAGFAGRPDAGAEAGMEGVSPLVFGDADCSGTVDSKDGLVTLLAEAGVADYPCAAITDVRCDATQDVSDAGEILRQQGGMAPSVAGCPPAGTSLAPLDPDPTLVNVVLRDDHSVTQTVGPDGGEVVATGDDGTTYTLIVPEGTLAVEESITLTPIASVSGLPLSGGLSGGVVVGPDELLFLEPVMLDVAPAGAPAGEEVVGFGVSGNEFFLYPLLPEVAHAGVASHGDGLIRLPYLGPGGYGVSSGSGVEIDGQQGKPPTAPEDQFSQELYVAFREREYGTPEFFAALETALRNYYQNGLLVALQYAPVECVVTRELLVPYVKWHGIIQATYSLGDPTFANEIEIMRQGLTLGAANCFDEVYQKCKDSPNGDDVVLLLKYLGLFQAGIVGDGTHESIEEHLGDVMAKIDECTPAACQGTGADCRWVGTATAEAVDAGGRVFEVSVAGIVFEFDQQWADDHPGTTTERFVLAEVGPIVWEVSGGSNCSGTMAIDPPDGESHVSNGEAFGSVVVHTVEKDYNIVTGGWDDQAKYTCGGFEYQFPPLSWLHTGVFGVPFEGDATLIARGERDAQEGVYQMHWTWDLLKMDAAGP